MREQVKIYDSTLRDGAQSEGIAYSIQDKLRIATALDELGISYIEAGNPGASPKDMEFFKKIKEKPLKNAQIVAFGSTRRKDYEVDKDPGIKTLLEADTQCVAIFGKTWDIHVRNILKADPGENLEMIYDTVKFLKESGREVVFDAEHFFDGYKSNREYAIKAVEKAAEAGTDVICLCDTNGGSFPDEIYNTTKEVKNYIHNIFPDTVIGIHAHDDGGMAVANSVNAVFAGAGHVQGTMAGFGERCGNANLSTVIANLQIKRNIECIEPENIKKLTVTVRQIAEISNIKLNRGMPYVGKTAFTHKAGMHVDGMLKMDGAFEHVNPESVGNSRRIVMSEAAGRSLVIEKIRRFLPEINKDSQEAANIVNKIKELEYQGYAFEGAESSFELIVMKLMGKFEAKFEIEKMNIISEQTLAAKHKATEAIVKVKVGEKSEITAAEGDGPVNALDKALRKALEAFFPEIGKMRLVDYKVRVLDSSAGTGAKVRVIIETTDGTDYWTTVGVSNDVIKASGQALIDSIEYKLLKI